MKMIRARRLGWLAVALALALSMLCAGWAGSAAGSEREAGVAPRNTILVIDNSRSTTGAHSLGGATDPKGMRFEAAKLVYQNVATSAATGSKGKLGVIVFCGTENCVSYGPLDIDDPALDEAIGSKLNAAANAKRRDDFTDIRTALQTAKDMMAGFEGKTGVILLTDGVNDLTNKSNPFSRPENIEANEQSVRLVEEMRADGADFFTIALTDKQTVEPSEAFMVFINQLATAGGGEVGEDGEANNVLVATETDLDSKLLQMLIKAESASDSIQTIVERTPLEKAFVVPYEGIADATLNITFMPEDKAKLEAVTLTAPGGESYQLWDKEGPKEQAGITVTESRSYIMLDIPSPQAGDWRVSVAGGAPDGAESTRALINGVVRFNHNLRLNVAVDEAIRAGEPARVEAWLQRFDGEQFVDLTDSGIYEQSEARLRVTTPSGNHRTVKMTREGDRFAVSFLAKAAGTWSARVRLQNPYVQETAEDVEFVVAEAPTPEPAEEAGESIAEDTPEPVATPTPAPAVEDGESAEAPTPEPTPRTTPKSFAGWSLPTPTPTPEVAPIEKLELSIEPCATTETGEIRLLPGKATFSWTLEGETDSVNAALLQDGKAVRSLISGASINTSAFSEEHTYAFRVSAMPKNGSLVGAQPTVESLEFKAPPSAIAAEAIRLDVQPRKESNDEEIYVDRDAGEITVSWAIDGDTDPVSGVLYEDGKPVVAHLKSGDSLERATLKDGSTYTLSVSATPAGGAQLGVEPTTQTLDFRLYPLPEPVEGLTLEVPDGTLKDGVATVRTSNPALSWRYEKGNVERYELAVTDAKGNVVQREAVGGSQTGTTLAQLPAGSFDIQLTAVPRYASGAEDPAAATATARVRVLSMLERYWYFLAGALALAALVTAVLLLMAKERNAKRVSGTLRVRCDALALDETLTLTDDRKGVKLDEPITRHAQLAKLKGKKAYAVLSNVRLNNVFTDRMGRAPGEAQEGEPLHRANVKLVRVTYTDPRTHETVTRNVGRYDIAPAVIRVEDGGIGYEITFSGS